MVVLNHIGPLLLLVTNEISIWYIYHFFFC